LDWTTAIDFATLGSWIEKFSVSKDVICSDAVNDFYNIVYPSKLNFENARLMCNHLGGSMYYPKVKSFIVRMTIVCPCKYCISNKEQSVLTNAIQVQEYEL